jgi:hypothetical protein
MVESKTPATIMSTNVLVSIVNSIPFQLFLMKDYFSGEYVDPELPFLPEVFDVEGVSSNGIRFSALPIDRNTSALRTGVQVPPEDVSILEPLDCNVSVVRPCRRRDPSFLKKLKTACLGHRICDCSRLVE